MRHPLAVGQIGDAERAVQPRISCSPAKLRLLGEYRENRAGLIVHLTALHAEAAEHLAGLDHGSLPMDLTARFVGWARAR